MIGEALEITIVVSMLVLVGYPSTLMMIEALRARRRRRGVQAGRPNGRLRRSPGAPTVAATAAEPPAVRPPAGVW